MCSYPKISVITPSYNQAGFIEETIKSVLVQDYPHLEYIIIDGGSTDGTTGIIEKYREHLFYSVSEKDKGQADAINKGFKVATGDIICWLNSDDIFEPNALKTVAESYQETKADFIYGDGWLFGQGVRLHNKYATVKPGIVTKDILKYCDPLHQPSTFWTRAVLDEVGFLDENLHYVLDWEFFIRISQKFKLVYVPFPFSGYRIHQDCKTESGNLKRSAEIIDIIQKYASEDWVKLYLDLEPYCTELLEMKKSWKRFYIPFFLKHPRLLLNYDFQNLKVATGML